MQSELTSIKNPVWIDAAHTAVNCEITTSQFGDEVLPFTASPNDVEPHGRAIFASIIAGDYGPIEEYIDPSKQDQPIVDGAQTL
jgi:hypothetical protein